MKRVGSLSEIVESTDSKRMLEIAKEKGVIAMERSKELVDESRPYTEFVRYFAENLQAEHIMRCPVTASRYNFDIIQDSIENYFETLEKGLDFFTVAVKFLHYMMNEDGPMNFSTGIDHKGSQNLPVWYQIAWILNQRKLWKSICFNMGRKYIGMKLTLF